MRYRYLHIVTVSGGRRKLPITPPLLTPPSTPLILFPILQLATLAGPLAGEELHGLCFLLEKVEITEECLGGTGTGNGNPSAAAVPPPPPGLSSEVVDGDGDDGSGGGEKGGVLNADAVGGENDADDNGSVGKGSVQSGATGSNQGERREPRQVRALRRC